MNCSGSYFECYKFAFDVAKRAEKSLKHELMRPKNPSAFPKPTPPRSECKKPAGSVLDVATPRRPINGTTREAGVRLLVLYPRRERCAEFTHRASEPRKRGGRRAANLRLARPFLGRTQTEGLLQAPTNRQAKGG